MYMNFAIFDGINDLKNINKIKLILNHKKIYLKLIKNKIFVSFFEMKILNRG